MDAAHIQALADGGDNEPRNIKPMPHDEHVTEHKAKGDFSRWAKLKGASRQSGSAPRTNPSNARPNLPQRPPAAAEDMDTMLDEIPLDDVPIIVPE